MPKPAVWLLLIETSLSQPLSSPLLRCCTLNSVTKTPPFMTIKLMEIQGTLCSLSLIPFYTLLLSIPAGVLTQGLRYTH